MSLMNILLSAALAAPAALIGLAPPQSASPSPVQDAGAVEAELQKLVGAKNTIVVVAANDGLLWAFFADRIKSATGPQLGLKKNSPVASSKGDAPAGGMADALGLSKKDDAGKQQGRAATREEIADALLGQMRQLGNAFGRWGGYWFTAPGPGQSGVPVAGVAGLSKGEQEIRVTSVVKVENK